MTKRYATTYSNGHTVETTSAHEAMSFQNYDDAQTWRVAGKQVTAVEFFSAVRSAVDAAWDKKNQTHKRVRVLHGNSVASYVNKWVPR
jgi:hypothetical protein